MHPQTADAPATADAPRSGRAKTLAAGCALAAERGCYLFATSALVFIYARQIGPAAAASAVSAIGAFVYLAAVLLAFRGVFAASCAALFGLAAGYFGLGVFEAPAAQIAATAAFALASGLFKPNFTAYFQERAPFKIYYLFVNLGMIGGLLLLPYLQQKFGHRAAFLLAAGLCFAAALALFFARAAARATAPAGTASAKKTALLILPACCAAGAVFGHFLLFLSGGIVLCWAILQARAPKQMWRPAALNVLFYVLIFQAFNVVLLHFAPVIDFAPGWLLAWMFGAGLCLTPLLGAPERSFKIGLFFAAAAALLLALFAPSLPLALAVYALFGAAQLFVGASGLEIAKNFGQNAQIYALWFLGSAAAQGIESALVLALNWVDFSLYFGLIAAVVAAAALAF